MARKKARGLGILPKGSHCVAYKIGPSGKKRCAKFKKPEGVEVEAKCIAFQKTPAGKRCKKYDVKYHRVRKVAEKPKKVAVEVPKKRKVKKVAGLEGGRRKARGGGVCETIIAHGRTLQVCKTINPKTKKDFFYIKPVK